MLRHRHHPITGRSLSESKMAAIAKLFTNSRGVWRLAFTKCRMVSSTAWLMTDNRGEEFNEKILEYLVCPLSKKPLRYDREKNELISEELQVAYPIVKGIPNLVPQDARMLSGSRPSSNQDTGKN